MEACVDILSLFFPNFGLVFRTFLVFFWRILAFSLLFLVCSLSFGDWSGGRMGWMRLMMR